MAFPGHVLFYLSSGSKDEITAWEKEGVIYLTVLNCIITIMHGWRIMARGAQKSNGERQASSWGVCETFTKGTVMILSLGWIT